MADITRPQIPYWESKDIHEFSQDEWESLCDGCGKCCLQKLQDEDTEEIYFTNISCQFLNKHSCKCKVYDQRFEYLPECLNLTQENLKSTLPWLPDSCSYKLVYEKKPLPSWHHLISENKETIHLLNFSVRDKVINELDVEEDDWQDFIVDIDK
tara:strand:- start:3162 stop:3623 length:462 start_codon:yes stop_codon:yes gene_type:complete